MITREGYCSREIKMRITIAKEAFNRKISLLTSKVTIELKKKLIYMALYDFRDLDTKKIGTEVFGKL